MRKYFNYVLLMSLIFIPLIWLMFKDYAIIEYSKNLLVYCFYAAIIPIPLFIYFIQNNKL